jgi:hypothetical protein
MLAHGVLDTPTAPAADTDLSDDMIQQYSNQRLYQHKGCINTTESCHVGRAKPVSEAAIRMSSPPLVRNHHHLYTRCLSYRPIWM